MRAPLLIISLLFFGCASSVAPVAHSEVSSGLQEQEAPASAAAQATRAQQLMVRGLTRAYLDDHEGALKLFQEASRLRPSEPALLSAMATSYAALGDVASATFYAQQAVTLAPEVLAFHQELAHLYVSLGDAVRALAAYDALLARFPGHQNTLFERAQLQTSLGRYEDALASYRTLLDHVGARTQVLEEILQLYLYLDDRAGLRQTLEALIQLEPSVAAFHRMLGEWHAEAGQPEAAIAAFEAALAVDPTDVETLLALSNLYRHQGQAGRADALLDTTMLVDQASTAQLLAQAAPLYARARDDRDAADAAARLLRKVLASEPDNLDALVMLGEVYYQQGAYAEAAPPLQRAAQLNPRDLDRWVQAATAYLEADRPDEAVAVADEALLLFPGQLALLQAAGYGLMAAFRNQDAIARFGEALDLLHEAAPDDDRQRAELLAALALLHGRTQAYATSDSLYTRALHADPLHTGALNNYAFSLAGRGLNLPLARSLAQRAVELEPGNDAFLDTLGWVHFKMEAWDEARQWLEMALAVNPRSAAALEHLGDVLARQGRFPEARQHWQQALQYKPGDADLLSKLEQQQR